MDNTKFKENLPILRHFEADSLKTSVDSFRKGEKGLFNMFKLFAFGAIGYFSWIYVLPQLFQMLGQAIAIIGTGILIVGLIFLAPVILKAIRRFTRLAHKTVIKHDPFGELEEQKGKMLNNKRKFKEAQGTIQKLRRDMQIESKESEELARTLERDILKLNDKVKSKDAEIEEMKKKDPKGYKTTDKYIQAYTERMKLLTDAQRKGHKLTQEKGFVQKYGTRGAIMQKFNQKLTMVGAAMDIKIADFDATIDILKRDYDFAQKSKEATDTAKSAMLFTEGWEVEYALDVVTSTIAEDIAITASNLDDIDMLTSTYSMDSDELFENLDSLAAKITAGDDPVIDSKQYHNPEYKLTEDDKMNSNGFGDINF